MSLSKIVKSNDIMIKGQISLNDICEEEKNQNEEVEPQIDVAQIEAELNQKVIDTQAKCDEILNDANMQSEKILEESKQKSLEIEKKAYEEGYQQGTKNGYEDGYKEAYEENIEKAKLESSQIIENANRVLLEANEKVLAYMKENKKNILAISVNIAKRVLGEYFKDESSMDSLLVDVIKEYELKENFVIRVNNLYKESIENQILELKKHNYVGDEIFVLLDDSIENGNAVIECEKARLVVGVDEVMSKIKEELL
jgi:flagellar assembly protein FliH